MTSRSVLVGAWLVCAVQGCASGQGWARRPHACTQRGTAVVVNTALRTLWLCERGQPTKEYVVAIGTQGAGKTKAGDRRTPLGRYVLGAPRRSDKFFTFIPVGYPTAEQADKGYDGGAIGIHGPARQVAWLGGASTWIDWTQGCIAVGTVKEIGEVAGWVRAHPGAPIVIER